MSDELRPRYWDDVAEHWHTAQDRLWRQHSDAVNGTLLARWLPEKTESWWLKTDLFDEAVSEGLREALSERVSRLVGMDIAWTVAQRATASGWCRVVADVRALPFRDGSFEGVVSLSTLDHFGSRTDIATALRELHRVMRAGGRLIVTMDNLRNPKIALRSVLPWQWLRAAGLVPYQVGKTTGPGGLQQLVTAAGFDVEEVTAIQHSPRVLAVWLARRLAGASAARQQRFRAWLAGWECLERWPTRYWTGNFVAVRARKR